MTQTMIQETLNIGNRSVLNRKHENGLSTGQMTEVEEQPHDAPMKLGLIITNICISLLVMALLAVCFRI